VNPNRDRQRGLSTIRSLKTFTNVPKPTSFRGRSVHQGIQGQRSRKVQRVEGRRKKTNHSLYQKGTRKIDTEKNRGRGGPLERKGHRSEKNFFFKKKRDDGGSSRGIGGGSKVLGGEIKGPVGMKKVKQGGGAAGPFSSNTREKALREFHIQNQEKDPLKKDDSKQIGVGGKHWGGTKLEPSTTVPPKTERGQSSRKKTGGTLGPVDVPFKHNCSSSPVDRPTRWARHLRRKA